MAGDPSTIAAGETVPGFAIEDVVQESGPRVTYRARRDSGAVVLLKTLRSAYPRVRDVAELRREYRILDGLDVPGVIRVHSLVPWGAGNVAIEMEAFGLPLADFLAARDRAPLPLDRFFPLAIRLARTLGALHERDLVHKDVTPKAILVAPDLDDLRLADFGLCSELSRERQSTKLSPRLEGSLPYISPEQTGRMSRDVDYRSDYYSFGVTCFELLTGSLPFSASDPLQWVHRHISQLPPPARERNPEIPESLSQLLAKLMAKNAEDRYQSSFGLIADLERCREIFTTGDRSAVFPLGADDVSRTFQIPQRLYGREASVALLSDTFEDVAHGSTVFCLVSGYAGVGKSALVHEMGKAIVRRQGYLVEGKFDQFQQGSAYGALALALRGLVDQLLTESAERLTQWRVDLQRALGSNAPVLAELVPNLAMIIGEQPAVPELPPAEAQVRFQLTFLNAVKVLATAEHPLVLFMDDLQWSDVPTLSLLARLATTRDLAHLLIIGAYRDHAVDATHPLTVTLDQVRKTRELVELHLAPLAADAVDRLTADTLHTDVASVRSLGAILYEKAQGNPFFIKALLRRLHEDGAITFHAETGRWRWDTATAQAANVGENVVEFMVANLRRLPERTQQVLQLAACIGNTFDLRTLAIIAEQPVAAVGADLHEALTRQMVVPLTESYKFVGFEQDDTSSSYRFQHDRVQQAAYALIDEGRKQAVHLSVGRLIRDHVTAEEFDARLIEIVSQFNAGRALITDPAERLLLAELNQRAGMRAAQSSAYALALGFLHVGLEMVGPDAWGPHHDLMMALGSEVQRCAYLTAAYDEADEWTETILAKARTPLEKAEILSARTRQFATMGRMRESIATALAGLAVLGVQVAHEPGRDEVALELARVERNLGERAIAELIAGPEMSDPESRLAVRLIMEVFAASFLSGSGDLFPYLILKNVNLCLERGNSPEAAFAYGAYGMLLCGSLNDHALGLRYGKLAVAMNERFKDIALRSRIIYVYAMFVHHWSNHWSSMTPWFVRGIEAGYQSGDLLYLAYSAQDCIIWDPTLDLVTASEAQRKYLAIVRDCEYQDSYDSGTLFRQMQLNFQGLTRDTFSMNDDAFDEARCVAGMRERQFMTGIANYHIYKAEIHALYGDHAGALVHVEAQDRLTASAMSLPQLVRFCIVAFLTRASQYAAAATADRTAMQERLRAGHRQMAAWTVNCKENFDHLRLTMEAELAGIEGRIAEALALYTQAIASANESGFLRDEAVANERAARYLLALGLSRAAEGYLRAARHLFEQWGARRKVLLLDQEFPAILSHGGRRSRSSGVHSVAVDSTALDMSSVMKASQTISGEIVVEQLLRTTLQILLENAGGNAGYFVVQEGDELVLRAQVGAEDERDALALPRRLSSDGEHVLPLSVVNNALRTGAPIVLDDATASGRFSSDPYIVTRRPKSVICVPIQRLKRFSGAIYIENNLTTGAFTAERVEVIKLLSAQAAISMENAQLYEEQLQLTQAQGRFVPGQFLESLGHRDIGSVGLGEFVAREMSVMFADLRSFTPLAERLPPREVIDLLNRYFSRIGGPIADAGGFIDSYNGDEVMALFPLPADRAVEAGVGMLRALAEFNRESVAAGGPSLEMGVGVNSGPLVLGTVGSHDRLKCGVVGDTVNTASRIEQLTKRYGVQFLIGEQTQRALSAADRFSTRAVDRVAAKGKAQALTLFEVLDAEPPERRAAKEGTRPLLEAATARYVARDFKGADALLAEAIGRDPLDPVLALLADRCRRYAKTPPPDHWNGVETLETK